MAEKTKLKPFKHPKTIAFIILTFVVFMVATIYDGLHIPVSAPDLIGKIQVGSAITFFITIFLTLDD